MIARPKWWHTATTSLPEEILKECGLTFIAMTRRKQVYKITYPNGKIYVGMDLTGTGYTWVVRALTSRSWPTTDSTRASSS